MSIPSLTQKQHQRYVAYHEAGHAVIAIFLGYQMGHATMLPEGELAAHVTTSCPRGTEDHIIVALAGVVCLDVCKIPSTEYGGAAQDMADIFDDLAQLIPDDFIEPLDQLEQKRERVYRRLQKRTDQLLRKRVVKKAVRVLAAELRKREAMDGAAVHAIVDPILAPRVRSRETPSV